MEDRMNFSHVEVTGRKERHCIYRKNREYCVIWCLDVIHGSIITQQELPDVKKKKKKSVCVLGGGGAML